MKKKSILAILVGTVMVLIGFALASMSESADQTEITPASLTGLVGQWHFDEGYGNTVYDSSGNGNHGTIYGATWTRGIIGFALKFGGEAEGDYVDLDKPPLLNISYPMTIEAWIKRDSYNTGTADDIICHGTRGYVFWLSKAIPNVVCFGYQGGGVPNSSMCSITTIQDNLFHHVAVTHNGSTAKIYIDGQLDNSGPMFPTFQNDLPLWIGGCKDYHSEYFDGIIDEVSIYNRVLSAEEIKADYLIAILHQIEELNLPQGIEDSLISKVENAIASLEKGNTEVAINQLEAFINQVEALEEKKISEEDAEMLIEYAENIID